MVTYSKKPLHVTTASFVADVTTTSLQRHYNVTTTSLQRRYNVTTASFLAAPRYDRVVTAL